ncbi:sugar O-acetyltransferase [Algoriphagus yeomjeoni]|uniref:Acetyltransferase-like isoleucine patch superfamily enzyme n=1 Tax=Algoriphagus yeomjeoni TaxID=291403 RepID=A0A327P895_9BACT|nr:sugar O-acetyltransferase [Algoriphagus yeomjeoni]RAI88459.1 acetyltransferase-like isoleucine patch superfamily enzyme [Algoriphagus yeomjeoni]
MELQMAENQNKLKAQEKLVEIRQELYSDTPTPLSHPAFKIINSIVQESLVLVAQMNASGKIEVARDFLSKITGQELHESVTLFPPFTTNFGRFTSIGKDVFINHGCSFLDLGGITIEDQVLIGPHVKLVTENHPLDPKLRRGMLAKPILIKKNAWIGAGAIVLPGVTIGENSVIAAGAVVSKDVPDNTVVGGIPAKILKTIEDSR